MNQSMLKPTHTSLFSSSLSRTVYMGFRMVPTNDSFL